MLRGVYSAMITPFDKNENIDEKGVETIINWTIGKGITGVFTVASTGESWALSVEEKARLFRLTVAIVNKRVPVIAGVGAPSTRESIQLAEDAQQAGVDYLCAAPPSFVRPTQDEMLAHYRDLAQATSVPLLLYNIPMLAGNVIGTPAVKTLAKRLPRVAGIKDSGGDLTVLNDLLIDRRPDFSVVTGMDTLVLPGLLAGSQGAILGSANVCPELSLEVFRLFEAGRLQDAWAVQNRLTRFWLAMGLGSFPAPVKAAVELLGLPAGTPRRPVAPLGTEQRAALQRELRAMGVL
ncbi:MAG: 4-hydroxy-tetrahydrodipicolinate synthase [Deltaproteobacteria bacterium]|nr:4-hydroxy-tetrahydrodipicolinate synthase [Deltaproteobacteria bacterium]